MDQYGNEQVSLVTPFSVSEIEGYIKMEQERYVQIGINLNYTISIIDPPEYLAGYFDLSDGLDTSSIITDEISEFFGKMASESSSDLQVFILNELNKNSYSTHYGRSYWTSEHDGKSYKNAVLINGSLLDETHEQYVITHEIGHSIGLEHYAEGSVDEYNRNLMVPAVYTDRGPGVNSGRKRLIQQQENIAYSSPLVY